MDPKDPMILWRINRERCVLSGGKIRVGLNPYGEDTGVQRISWTVKPRFIKPVY